MSLSIRFEPLGQDPGGALGYVVTDTDRPAHTLVVYRDTHPATCAALGELDARLSSVTPGREAALLAVVARAWATRDAARSPLWAGCDPVATR